MKNRSSQGGAGVTTYTCSPLETNESRITLTDIYTRSFYDEFKDTSRTSAQVIVPFLMNWAAPTSVIDLGCGLGAWLAVFKEAGVREICGVDGDYVPRNQLVIPERAFIAYDLTRPYVADRQFDLAISLEVAEHLPPESGRALVESLADLAPVVVFSAAVPHQGGEHHINCRWPGHWADLFARRGYVAIDTLRFKIWEDSRVGWWYRQNIVIYVCAEQLSRWPVLEIMHRSSPARPLPLIHPEMFRASIATGDPAQALGAVVRRVLPAGIRRVLRQAISTWNSYLDRLAVRPIWIRLMRGLSRR